MSKPSRDLSSYFRPSTYLLEKDGDLARLTITGQKIGRPSHRISLHQSGIKVVSAKISRFDKNGPNEVEVIRINHLPTIQQVRLHSGKVMYPGHYQIDLGYKIMSENPAGLDTVRPSRELLPSIDETEAWRAAEFKIK